MAERYPLCWPEGWKRTILGHRTAAKFSSSDRHSQTDTDGTTRSWRSAKRLSVFDAIQRVQYELDRLGVRDGDAIISTNVPTRLDGLPRSDRAEPSDSGAAVYWTLKGRKQCMAIDQYTRVADNLAAIAATLEAIRTVGRHGGGAILDRAFTGFAALPEAAGGKSWREVLGLPRDAARYSVEEIQSRFKKLVKEKHPDVIGGNEDPVRELIWARDAAIMELTQS